VRVAPSPAAEAAFQALPARSGPSLAEECRVREWIETVLADLLTSLPPVTLKMLQNPSPLKTRLAPALNLLTSRFTAPPRVADLAAACELSENHFSRLFRQAMGQTPAHFGLMVRLDEACRRLALAPESIDDIAAQTGFANRFHFSRVFTAAIGLPPAAYRKRMSAGAVQSSSRPR
jgi:transcriptional regulator GlxA family with amidase domain